MAYGKERSVDMNGLSLEVDQIVVDGVILSTTDSGYIDGITPGTVTASKAVVVDSNKDIATFRHVTLSGNLVSGSTTISEADLGFIDGITAGTSLPSKALVLDANEELNWTYTSASTDGGTSVEPLNLDTTLTGIGGVGGRAKFTLTTNVALGSWSNALKGQVTYDTAGKTTGLGSAIVAEMTLSAGTTSGTYAPLELELNMGASGSCGTATSLIYGSVNDAAATTFDTSGYLLNLAGVTAGTSKAFGNSGTITNVNEITHGLRVKVAGSDYYILLATAAAFAG